MALELVYGPVDCVWEDTGQGADIFGGGAQWLDGIGLACFASLVGELDRYCICQLDGQVYQRNNINGAFYAGRLAWDELTQGLLYTYRFGSYDTYEFDALTGHVGALLWPGVLKTVARLKDRFARAYIGKFYSYDFITHAETLECTFAGGAVGGEGWISPAGGDRYYCCFDNGTIYLYDAVARAQVGKWKTIGMTCKGLWYSAAHDIFISLHAQTGAPDLLRVWANEVRPASVSTPTAVIPLVRGQIGKVRAQVLGAAGEPCAAMPVEWARTGPGELMASQSTTDENGYAEIECIVPPSASGDITISATVRC